MRSFCASEWNEALEMQIERSYCANRWMKLSIGNGSKEAVGQVNDAIETKVDKLLFRWMDLRSYCATLWNKAAAIDVETPLITG
jgi:hypothetical protein